VTCLLDVTLTGYATRQDAAYWKIVSRCLEGELLIRRGTFMSGTALLSNALDNCVKTGWAVCYPAFRGVLVEGLAGLGRIGESHFAVEQGLAAAERGGERWSVAELLRIKAESLLKEADDCSEPEAEDCFACALDVARQQGALFWELRAAMGLARLRVRQGRPDEARRIFAPVYVRFTEGFETPDLKAAQRLLAT
jgi:predicted ATPase